MRWLRAGLTMIETLVATSLMALVLMASLNIMGLGLSWWQRGWNRIDAQQNTRVALMHMTKEIQAAAEVIFGSNAEVLIIATPGGKQYKYELEGGNLRRAVKNRGSLTFEGYNLLAYGVQGLEFSYDRPEAPEMSRVITIRLVTCDAEGRDFKVTTGAAIRLRVMNRI